jgi:hypothetical protein
VLGLARDCRTLSADVLVLSLPAPAEMTLSRNKIEEPIEISSLAPLNVIVQKRPLNHALPVVYLGPSPAMCIAIDKTVNHIASSIVLLEIDARSRIALRVTMSAILRIERDIDWHCVH